MRNASGRDGESVAILACNFARTRKRYSETLSRKRVAEKSMPATAVLIS